MKKIITFVFLLGMTTLITSCDLLQQASEPGVSDADIASGLKEALDVGISNGVQELIQPDGYFANQAIKILLPDEVQSATNLIQQNVPGSDALLTEVILKMNRAAEDAANEAAPIFKDAITGMTFTDARNILFGADNAATEFLKTNTYTELQGLYAPKINTSLSKVGLPQLWSQIATPYNQFANGILGQIAGAKAIPADLGTYVTGKALDGLFFKVQEEESKIRKNVTARVSDLLKRVFGLLD
ncbi:hypothetical protein BKI52_23140 [marine bacterium AO1-C]|nr:hypothetical protein BKI52_23140 [marine bacterium AO1-C]